MSYITVYTNCSILISHPLPIFSQKVNRLMYSFYNMMVFRMKVVKYEGCNNVAVQETEHQ